MGELKQHKRSVKTLIVYASLAITVTACATVKPIRSLAPETFGLTCVTDTLCVEDPQTAPPAQRLATGALRFVEANIGSLNRSPKFLFCDTVECFDRFGHHEFSAQYVWGTNIIVINEAGWRDHIVVHEVIHHWQAEHFGLIKASSWPSWFIEGMAYSMSNDPRRPLPREDIEAYRLEFEQWLAAGNDWRVGPV